MPSNLEPVLALQASLPQVWDDFCGGEPGIIMCIWDASRLLWLMRPEYIAEVNPQLSQWVVECRQRAKVWHYCPVDSTGPGNKLTAMTRETLLGADRLLAYTPFGRDVILNTIGSEEAARRDLTYMPHGLSEVWRPDGRELDRVTRKLIVEVRRELEVEDDIRIGDGSDNSADPDSNSTVRSDSPATAYRIGVVATNQARKEWGAVAAICAELSNRLDNATFWWHTDTLIRFFSIEALLNDYNLIERVTVTTPPVSDQEMARRYRECDVTLHVGPEGFGYPIFESLACGVPAIHGGYAGGASILDTCDLNNLLVWPKQWRLEGQHNSLRPVYDPADWVEKVTDILRVAPQNMSEQVEHLKWSNLWPRWSHWFVDGLG